MNIISKVKKSIENEALLSPSARVIVATSGGADSVALLAILNSLGYDCIAAHCNFHLRGEESDRDMKHVQMLCQKLNIQLHITHFDVHQYCEQKGLSLEMACRELRYEWFDNLLVSLNAEAIAVAHHREDNIETFFLNLLRGTGIAGLTGMKPRNGKIIRPMLDCTRAEIEKYLADNGLTYVTDSTNAQNDFKRNRLRNIILPSLEQNFSGASDAILATIANLTSQQSVYQAYISNCKAKYFNGDSIAIDQLIAEESNAQVVLFELLKPYGFNITQVKDIIASSAQSGRQFSTESTAAVLNRGTLEISTKSIDVQEDTTVTIDLSSSIDEPISLSVETLVISDFAPSRDCNSIYLDKSVLDGNPVFQLRHWREGDRLKPFGMKGTQKVSDIFNNAKVSITNKSKIWLLTRNDEILWIVGIRASRLFPVTKTTNFFIKITDNVVKKDN